MSRSDSRRKCTRQEPSGGAAVGNCTGYSTELWRRPFGVVVATGGPLCASRTSNAPRGHQLENIPARPYPLISHRTSPGPSPLASLRIRPARPNSMSIASWGSSRGACGEAAGEGEARSKTHFHRRASAPSLLYSDINKWDLLPMSPIVGFAAWIASGQRLSFSMNAIFSCAPTDSRCRRQLGTTEPSRAVHGTEAIGG
jgi:hypothetical protein